MSRDAARRRWSELIRRQSSSGLSIAAFCRRHGLAPATFYQWRRKLRSDEAFVALSVVGGAGVSVELPCGAVVRVPAGDDRSLRQIIEMLLGDGESS